MELNKKTVSQWNNQFNSNNNEKILRILLYTFFLVLLYNFISVGLFIYIYGFDFYL